MCADSRPGILFILMRPFVLYFLMGKVRYPSSSSSSSCLGRRRLQQQQQQRAGAHVSRYEIARKSPSDAISNRIW